MESKKGALSPSKSSKEYPLIREAIGQLVTIDNFEENMIIAVAIPKSDKFRVLIEKWKNEPLVKKIGLEFFMINRNGNVESTIDFQ